MDAIKIVVCGDSFCASNEEYRPARSHFSQILEDRYGYHVTNLAHGGFSNLAILWQIQEAVSMNPYAVVYNQTWSSRVNLAYRPDSHPGYGLRNFIYYNDHYSSSRTDLVGTVESGNILSTVPDGIDASPFFNLSKEQLEAVRLYVKYFYHPGITEETDNWLFDYWHQRIQAAGIVPLRFNDDDIGRPAYDFCQQDPSFDSPYHTDQHTQERIAQNIHQKLSQ